MPRKVEPKVLPRIGMNRTSRDEALLALIYRYDGMLSVDQITRWFFTTKKKADERITRLCEHGYLKKSTRQDLYRTPTQIVWLAEQGAAFLAEQHDSPMEKFRWRSEPKWDKIKHDIFLNECRRVFEMAATGEPFTIEDWHGQDESVHTFVKPVEYRSFDGTLKKRLVQPDGIVTLYAQSPYPHRFRFCIEFDNSSESNVRFGRDKVAPGIQFVQSAPFQQYFGTSVPARFLVIVANEGERFRNMRRSVLKSGGAAYFFFATMRDVLEKHVYTDQIWFPAHTDDAFSLTEYDTDGFQQAFTESLRDVDLYTPISLR